MSRSVTLFTGQWADLSINELAPLAKEMGYDGLELACWGDHFDVDQAARSKNTAKKNGSYSPTTGSLASLSPITSSAKRFATTSMNVTKRSCLPMFGAMANRRVSSASCSKTDQDRQGLPQVFRPKPGRKKRDDFPAVVNGFTGSSIWHALYAFPPTDQAFLEKGFQDFANRFIPILDEFDKVNVNFGLEVHPTEIAFDIASASRAISSLKGHKRFGFNYDPSHLGYQGVDYVKFIRTFSDRIYHVHMKDVWWGHGNGDTGVFGGHTDFGDPRRYWDFRSLGHGDIAFEDIIVALNDIKYQGPLSVEWEDIRMDRVHGATEASAFVRSVDFPSSDVAFDSAFDKENQ